MLLNNDENPTEPRRALRALVISGPQFEFIAGHIHAPADNDADSR